MKCSNCGCGIGGSRKLCPVSLGLALGITCALSVIVKALWFMHYGVPPMMVAFMPKVITWPMVFSHAFWMLLGGFVFGFFVALFYDLIACCCKAMCCGSRSGLCSHCECCGTDKKNKTMR